MEGTGTCDQCGTVVSRGWQRITHLPGLEPGAASYRMVLGKSGSLCLSFSLSKMLVDSLPHHHAQIGRANAWNRDTTERWQGRGPPAGCATALPRWKAAWQFLQRPSTLVPYDPRSRSLAFTRMSGKLTCTQNPAHARVQRLRSELPSPGGSLDALRRVTE